MENNNQINNIMNSLNDLNQIGLDEQFSPINQTNSIDTNGTLIRNSDGTQEYLEDVNQKKSPNIIDINESDIITDETGSYTLNQNGEKEYIEEPKKPKIIDINESDIKRDDNGMYIDNEDGTKEYLVDSYANDESIVTEAAKDFDFSVLGSLGSYDIQGDTVRNQNMSLSSALDKELQEDFLAQNQTAGQLWGRSLQRGLNELTIGTLQGISSLISPTTWKVLFGQEVDEVEGELAKNFREIKESWNESNPIFRTLKSKSDNLLEAMTDPTFWAGNAESIVTTIGMLITGAGIGKGLALAGKFAGLGAKGIRLTSSIGGAFASRVIESSYEAKEAYDSYIQKYQHDPRYAGNFAKLKLDAGKAASMTMRSNMPLMAIDAFQLDNLAHGLMAFKKANTIGKKIFNKATDYAISGISEGLEEGTQFILKEEAIKSAYSGENMFGNIANETFGDRWDEYWSDIEMKTSILLGAVGGVGFKAIGSILGKGQKALLDQIEKNAAQKQLAALEGDVDAFNKMTDNEFQRLIIRHSKSGTLDRLGTLIDSLETKENLDEDQLNHIKAIKRKFNNFKNEYDRIGTSGDLKDDNQARTHIAVNYAEYMEAENEASELDNKVNTELDSLISKLKPEDGVKLKDSFFDAISWIALARVLKSKGFSDEEKKVIKDFIGAKEKDSSLSKRSRDLLDLILTTKTDLVDSAVNLSIARNKAQILLNERKSMLKQYGLSYEENNNKEEQNEKKTNEVETDNKEKNKTEQQDKVSQAEEEELLKNPFNIDPGQVKDSTDESDPTSTTESKASAKTDQPKDKSKKKGKGKQSKKEEQGSFETSEVKLTDDEIDYINSLKSDEEKIEFAKLRGSNKQESDRIIKEWKSGLNPKGKSTKRNESDTEKPKKGKPVSRTKDSKTKPEVESSKPKGRKTIDKATNDIEDELINSFNEVLNELSFMELYDSYTYILNRFPNAKEKFLKQYNEALESIDFNNIDNLTPMQAFSLVYAMKKREKGYRNEGYNILYSILNGNIGSVESTIDNDKVKVTIDSDGTIKNIDKFTSRINSAFTEIYTEINRKQQNDKIEVESLDESKKELDNLPIQDDDTTDNNNNESLTEEASKSNSVNLDSLNGFFFSIDKDGNINDNEYTKLIDSDLSENTGINLVGETIYFGVYEKEGSNIESPSDLDIMAYVIRDGKACPLFYINKESYLAKNGYSQDTINKVSSIRSRVFETYKSQDKIDTSTGFKIYPTNISAKITKKGSGIPNVTGGEFYKISEFDDSFIGIVTGYDEQKMNLFDFNSNVDDNNVPLENNPQYTGHVFLFIKGLDGRYHPLYVFTQKIKNLREEVRDRYIKSINDILDEYEKLLLENKSKDTKSNKLNELREYTSLYIAGATNKNGDIKYIVRKPIGPGKYQDFILSRDELLLNIDNAYAGVDINKAKDILYLNKLSEDGVLSINVNPNKPFHSPNYEFQYNEEEISPIKDVESKIEEKKTENISIGKKRGRLKGSETITRKRNNRSSIIDDNSKLFEKKLNIPQRNWNREMETRWLQKMLPQIPVEVADEIVGDLHRLSRSGGVQAWGQFKESMIVIAKVAEHGVAYHEAVHAVMALLLTENERNKLYDSARKIYNLKGSNDFIEEVLAEKFREYVNSDTYAETLLDKVSRFFRRIYNWIKYNVHLMNSIETFFYRINNGKYKSSKILPENSRISTAKYFKSNLDPITHSRRVDFLVDTMIGILDEFQDEYPELTRQEVINRVGIDSLVKQTYNDMMDLVYDNDGNVLDELFIGGKGSNKEEIVAKIDEMLDNFISINDSGKAIIKGLGADVLSEFARIEQITINLESLDLDNTNESEENATDNEEGHGILESWQIDYVKTSAGSKLRPSVRALFRNIILVTDDGKPIRTDDLGRYMRMNPNQVFATLLSDLSDVTRPEKMMDRLKELAKTKRWVKQIINKLEGNTDLQIQLWNSINSQSVGHIISERRKNKEFVYAANRTSSRNVLLSQWRLNFMMSKKKTLGNTINELESSIENLKNGTDSKTVSKAWSSSDGIKEDLKNNISTKIYNVLKIFNIDLTKDEIGKILDSFTGTRSDYVEVNGKWQFVDGIKSFNSKMYSKFMNEVYAAASKYKQYLKDNENELSKNYQAAYKDIDPFTDNNMPSVVKALTYISNIANKTVRGDTYEQSANVKGATYATNITPSFVGRLIQRLIDKDAKTIDKFTKSFFHSKDNGKKRQTDHFLINQIIQDSEISIDNFLGINGVEYGDMGDAHYTAAILNLFRNGGNKEYGYFFIPTPSDASTIPVIKLQKLDTGVCISNMTNLALKEIQRIMIVQERAKNNSRKISGFDDVGNRFILFPFLNESGKSLEELSDVNVLRDLIKKEVEKRFNEFKEDIILSKEFVDPAYFNESGDVNGDMLMDAYYNCLTYQYGILTMTSIDPAFYGSAMSFYKRNKQIMSPGRFGAYTLANISEKYKAIFINDEYLYSSQAKSYYDNVKENALKEGKSRNEAEDLAKSIASKFGYYETEKNGVKGVELSDGSFLETESTIETDGQSFITLDRYRDIMIMFGKWGKGFEEAYQRILNDTATLNDLMMFQMQPIKPHYYSQVLMSMGVQSRDSKKEVYGLVPLQIKDSQHVLIPKLIKGNKKLESLLDTMRKNDIKAAHFSSTTKVGLPKDVYSSFSKNGKFNFYEDDVIELSNDDYKLQTETPNHFSETTALLGSQIKKHIQANLPENSTYEIQGEIYNRDQMLDLIDSILTKISDDEYTNIINEIGTDEGLAKLINRTLQQRKYSDNVTEAAQYVNKERGIRLPISDPTNFNLFTQIIASEFRKTAKPKVSGGSLYQVSSIGLDDKLKIVTENGHIKYVECIMPYPYKKMFSKYTDEKGMINMDKVIADGNEDLLKVIAYRIPTEDKYSAFPLRIVGFSSPLEGGIIKLPTDTIKIAGFDFDRLC